MSKRTILTVTVRAVFVPYACLAVTSTRNGPPAIAVQTVDGWIEAIGGSGVRWDEQVFDIDVDDAMASSPVAFSMRERRA
jgi:hypothetical protein